ncbi:unnamed protein product [Rotaria sp. Silwood1]|nr:unnamed protein product [Rotaria sp. Silwood1]
MSMYDEEYRLISEQRKHHTSPSLEIPESSEILRQQKKHQLLTRKQINSSKLNKDEIKYQRFVHGLQKEIKVYINQSLRESRFNTRVNQCSEINPSFPTGPAMKSFYLQFIRPPRQQHHQRNPYETTLLYASEQ